MNRWVILGSLLFAGCGALPDLTDAPASEETPDEPTAFESSDDGAAGPDEDAVGSDGRGSDTDSTNDAERSAGGSSETVGNGGDSSVDGATSDEAGADASDGELARLVERAQVRIGLTVGFGNPDEVQSAIASQAGGLWQCYPLDDPDVADAGFVIVAIVVGEEDVEAEDANTDLDEDIANCVTDEVETWSFESIGDAEVELRVEYERNSDLVEEHLLEEAGGD